MCSAASPGRASGDAHIVAPRVQPRSGSRPFHRGARGSSNRVRERVPNRVLPLLRFLCSTPEPHRQSYPARPKGTRPDLKRDQRVVSRFQFVPLWPSRASCGPIAHGEALEPAPRQRRETPVRRRVPMTVELELAQDVVHCVWSEAGTIDQDQFSRRTLERLRRSHGTPQTRRAALAKRDSPSLAYSRGKTGATSRLEGGRPRAEKASAEFLVSRI
jgi:hypothetical protein